MANPEAPAIHIETVGHVEARFIGVGFDPGELSNLLSAALAGPPEGASEEQRRRAEVVRLVGLAVVNANMTRAVVENVDAEGRLRRITIDAEGRGVVDEAEDPAEHQRPPGWTRVDFDGWTGSELSLLRERCLLSSVAIHVEGEREPYGPLAAFTPKPVASTKLRDPEGRIIGLAGIEPARGPGRVHILTRGVLAETLTPDYARPGFVAVVDVDLRKDLSQAKLIRDEAFFALERSLRAAHDALPWAQHEQRLAARGRARQRRLSTVAGAVFVLLIGALIAAWFFDHAEGRLSLLRRSCEKVSSDNCWSYVGLLDLDNPRERSEAATMLMHACRRDDARACMEVIDLRPSHSKMVREAAARACDLDQPRACALEIEEVWAQCLSRGRCQEVRGLSDRVCAQYQTQLDPMSRARICTLAGFLHHYGYGAARDHQAGQRSFATACGAGAELACRWVDAPEAGSSGCDAGDAHACYALGVSLLREREGDAIPDEARERFAAACAGGLDQACSLADPRFAPGDEPRAVLPEPLPEAAAR